MVKQCSECDYCKPLEDNRGKTFYFCVSDESPCYLEECGLYGNCGWDDDEETEEH